ncbi:MAG TPA: helix-turn-helix domain-containing protein, partial [Solirubrobacterales bacterium]|nr:helix-turn-helix domain-containing protein [Solirubrobacterales bacterium]
HWPGNIRELEHLVERAVLTAESEVLKITLPPPTRGAVVPLESATHQTPPASENGTQLVTLAAHDRAYLERVLRHTHGRVSGPRGAAAILGLKPSTLRSRMKKLGLSLPPEE